MSDVLPDIPEYKVIKKGEPRLTHKIVETIGYTGLSQIVAIVPAFDPSDKFFTLAQLENRSHILPLHKIAGDKALLFEVSASGEDEDALSALNQTIDNIGTLANVWHDPDRFLKLIYPDTPATS